MIIVITHHDGIVDVTIHSYHQAKSAALKGLRRLIPSLGAKARSPESRQWGRCGKAGNSRREPDFDAMTSGSNVRCQDSGDEGSRHHVRRGCGCRRRQVTVNPGEVVGMIGPNGAGKTTILDIATGFH